MPEMNTFAALSKLQEKKKNVVVDTTTASRPQKAKTEKKEAAPKAKAAAKPAAGAAPAKKAAAPAKKGEALGAKVGGPSSLNKIAAASKAHATKEEEVRAKLAEKEKLAAERRQKREEERAAKKAEEGAKEGEDKTDEEKAFAEKREAERKKAEEEDAKKKSMKDFEKEREALRFKVETNARHVDPNAGKGKTTLKAFGDDEGIVIKKEAPKPKTAAKNTKAPAAKTQQPAKKEKKAETVNFMDLAAKNGNFGSRRQGGRGGRGGNRGDDKPAAAVPKDEAFPDLA